MFKIKAKIFLLLALDESPPKINVKCDPEWAQELRMRYRAVAPGYHMNKRHWNTVNCDESLSEQRLYEFIRHPYDLVAGKANK